MGQVNGNSSQLEKTKHTIQMQMFKERNIIRLATIFLHSKHSYIHTCEHAITCACMYIPHAHIRAEGP